MSKRNYMDDHDKEYRRYCTQIALGFAGVGAFLLAIPVIGNYFDKADREKKDMAESVEYAKKEHAYRAAAFPPANATAQLIHAELNKGRALTIKNNPRGFDRAKPIHISDRKCYALFSTETAWAVTLPDQKQPVLLAAKDASSYWRSVGSKADPSLNEPITELDAFSIQPKGGLDTLQHWKVLLEKNSHLPGTPDNSPATLVQYDPQGQVSKKIQIQCKMRWQVDTRTEYFFEGAPGSNIKGKSFISSGYLFQK